MLTVDTSVPLRSLTMILSAPPRALKSMVSTSLRSMVTLAMSRKNARMIAIGRDVDVLGDVRAVEQHRVGAVLALDGVVVVARVPDEDVVAGAHVSDIIAVAAIDQVVAAAADDESLPRPPFSVSAILPASRRAGVDDVVAAVAVDGELVGRVGGEQAGLRLQAATTIAPPSAATVIDVGALRAVDRHAVGRTVAGGAAGRRARSILTCVTSVPLRSPTTMLSAPPSAWKSMRSTSLRSIVTLATSRVNRACAAVGENVDVLGDVRAVEQHRVDAVPAIDRVVAVARVPLEQVVAGAHQRNVVALVAVDEVVAVAADQRVGAVAAEDGVVAGAAVDGELDDVGRRGRRDDVSLPPRPLTTRMSFAPSAPVTLHLRPTGPTTDTEVPAPTMSIDCRRCWSR